MCGPAPAPGRGYGHCPLQILVSHYFAAPPELLSHPHSLWTTRPFNQQLKHTVKYIFANDIFPDIVLEPCPGFIWGLHVI